MALTKKAISEKSRRSVKALNRPRGWEIYNLPAMIKTASVDKMDEDLHGFDLKSAVKEHPEHLYLKIFAIKEDEMNDNGDSFSGEELEKAAETFIGVPIFTNHENDDVEKARGDCVHAWYDKEEGGIFIIARVDKVAYPKLARGIEEGFIKGTSMGCSVEYSLCSVCHNKAHTADEYCTHIKNSKTRKFNGTCACKYKKSSCKPDDECPICSKSNTNKEAMSHEDTPVFEHNYGLKFIENSFVVNPACHTCGVTCVLHIPELEKKVAALRESVNKVATAHNTYLEKINKPAGGISKGSTIKARKVAGQQELDMLKSAMDNMESVVKSMMTQKEQIDMEYVSDLVKAMADVQSTVDELMDMGYSQLPSPPNLGANAAAEPFPAPAEQEQPEQQPKPPVQTSEGPASTHTDLMGGMGSVTKPKAASIFINKKKDFLKVASNLRRSISTLSAINSNLKRSEPVSNTTTHVWANENDSSSFNVMIDDDFVTEANGDQVLKVSKISELDSELQDLISSDPKVAAQKLLSGRIKESTMKTETEKTAQVGPQGGGEASQREVITEKQLKSHAPELHPRKGKTYETITQDQIGDKGNEEKDTTSESPQIRSGTYETITEDQMASFGGNEIVRWNDVPEVITEKQWTEVAREVRAALPDDWTETITEDQLRNLLENHRFVGTYETITQDQLKHQDWGIKRWANKNYVRSLLKVAMNAVAHAISTYRKTPDELSGVISKIADNNKYSDKVALLTLVNSLKSKKEARKTAAKRALYFRKSASSDVVPGPTEALILAVAEAAQAGLKVEDVYESIGHILSKKEAMSQVDKLIEKISNTADEGIEKVDKFASLDEGIESMDGVEIRTTVAEVGADPKDKKAFITACKKHAQELAGDDSLTLLEVKLDESSGAIIIELGEGAEMEGDMGEPEVEEFDFTEDLEGDTEVEPVDEGEGGFGEEGEEDCAPCNKPAMPGQQDQQVPEQQTEVQLQEQRMASRKQTVKQAQMMGGELGGQGGAGQAPGAGASLPQPPQNEAPAVESFTDEPSALDDVDAGGLMPKPPGTSCPVCTSDDVDVVSGKFTCNNCGSEGIIKVSIEVNKWADLTGGSQEEGMEDEEGIEGEGFELPEGDVAPEMPVAAMVRMKPEALQKVASIKENVKKAIEAGDDEAIANMTKAVDEGGTGISEENLRAMAEKETPFGSLSPITGTTRTVKVDKNTFIDLAAGQKYQVKVAGSKSGKAVYAQWEWTPKHPKNICPSCRRARKRFASALEQVGLTEKEFDAQSITNKAKTIIAMKKAGALKAIKTADKNGSVIEDYKKAYGVYGDQFPSEACRERLARRYGQNALALSGPCEGQPIYDCVCKSLSNAGVYSDNLATKVASIWADKDGTEDCIEDQVRHGLNIRSAAVVCSALKTAIAGDEDFLADDLGPEDPMDEGPIDEGPVDADPMDDIDPFEGEDMGGGTVTLELDADLAEQLDAQLDVALGDSPDELAEEGHHDPETVNEIAEDGVADVSDEGLGGDAASDGDEMLDELAGKPCDDGMGGMMDAKPAMPGEAGIENPETNEGISPEVIVKKKDTGPADQEDLGFKPGQPGMSMASAEYNEDEARRMSSKLGNTGRISLDLEAVAAALNKEAGEKTIQKELVQDSGDIGQYSAGDPLGGDLPSAMFHENESVPTAAHPSVPRSDARMGHEDENIDKDETLPNIPSDKGTMGHEDEVGLSGGDVRFTGGTGAGGAGSPGAGQAEVEASEDADIKLAKELAGMKGVVGNAKQRTDSLVERLLAIREAGKLEEKKPVSPDKDIDPVSGGGKGIGHEPKFTADKPENTEGSGNESQMGHESESMGDRPTSPKDHPEIPEDDARMGHEEEDIKPEKQLKDKGTVIAGSDEESEVQSKSAKDEATRLAGRMLEEGIIKSAELSKKIAELSNYELGQIQDIEKAMFSKARKGFAAASEGVERPLVVNEASNDRSQTIEVKDAASRQAELIGKLTNMFTLGKRNKQALEDPDYELRKTFGQG